MLPKTVLLKGGLLLAHRDDLPWSSSKIKYVLSEFIANYFVWERI